jgi:hypothetical protein
MGSKAIFKEYEFLLDKSQRSFNRLRDLGATNTRWEHHFHKAFNIYSKLWKFQQQHRCGCELVGTRLGRDDQRAAVPAARVSAAAVEQRRPAALRAAPPTHSRPRLLIGPGGDVGGAPRVLHCTSSRAHMPQRSRPAIRPVEASTRRVRPQQQQALWPSPTTHTRALPAFPAVCVLHPLPARTRRLPCAAGMC